MGSDWDDRLVSVVMPVHNALPHLDEAIQSILDQTLRNFEFIIYDDNSTDGSAERLEEWARQDQRIKLFRGGQNLGPAVSSAHVVRYASAPFVARMDADDISTPDRLKRQAQLLKANPDVGLVASLCDVIDSHGRKLRDPELWRLTRNAWTTPFPHGSIMFRRELFEQIGSYRAECEFWEDLDLVLRASSVSRILVLPRPVYRYRQSTTSTRLTSDQERVEQAIDLRYRSLERVREQRSYDDLLQDDGLADDGRVDPRVFVSMSALALWSDQRPRLMRRFLKRARLRPNVPTVVAFTWLSWASVSPRSLRAFMALLSRLRNAATPPLPSLDEPVEWVTPAERSGRDRADKAGA